MRTSKIPRNTPQKQSKETEKIIEFILAVVALGLIIYFAVYMKMYGRSFIGSDDASELILANLLSKEHSILSKNWYYSTELRVFNTQLVFAPLFYLFDSWENIRTVGSTILLVLLFCTVLFWGKANKLKKSERMLLGIIFLLPYSTPYFVFVMSRTYYIPHICVSFLTLALMLMTTNPRGKGRAIVLNIVLCVLALFSGMGGLRQLLILYIPLSIAVCCIYAICLNEKLTKYFHLNVDKVISQKLFIRGNLALLFSVAGCLVNSLYLSKIYRFHVWDSIRFTPFSFEKFIESVNGILYSFGYLEGENIFSKALLNNLTCFLTIVLVTLAIISGLKDSDAGIEEKLSALFFLTAIVVFIGICCFTDFSYNARYNIPIIVFAFPIIVLYFRRKLLQRKNIFWGGLFVFCLFLSSTRNYQHYAPSEREQVVQTLVEHEYYCGYATFWNGNVLTELADGKIDVYAWNHDVNSCSDVDDLYLWLQLAEHNQKHPEEKIFVLFSAGELNSKMAKKFEGADILYSSDQYMVYGFDSYESMIEKASAYDFDFTTDEWLYSGNSPDVNKGRILYPDGLSYGPYIRLRPGTYEVTCTGENLKNAQFDAFSSAYPENAGMLDLFDVKHSDNKIEYRFSVNDVLENVETRIYNNTKETIILYSLSIRKVD